MLSQCIFKATHSEIHESCLIFCFNVFDTFPAVEKNMFIETHEHLNT